MKNVMRKSLSITLAVSVVLACFTATVFAAATPVGVSYSVHIQDIGWQAAVADGVTAGTSGQSKRVEALKIDLTNKPAGAKIAYQVHVQDHGWMPVVSDGAIAGTAGESKRIEAIALTISGVSGYTIQYRVHVQDIGWMNWVSGGSIAGTVGQSKRMEAIQIRLVTVVNSISITPAMTLSAGGAIGTITATVDPASAVNDISWASDNTAAATVSNGVVTPLAAGTAAITASVGGMTATCLVTVISGAGITAPAAFGSITAVAGAKIYANSIAGNVVIVGSETNDPYYYFDVDILKLVKVARGSDSVILTYNSTDKDFDVFDGSNILLGTVQLSSSDTTNIPVATDGQTIMPAAAFTDMTPAFIIFSLVQGSTVIGTVSIPVVYDVTPPSVPVISTVPATVIGDQSYAVTVAGTAEADSLVEVDFTYNGGSNTSYGFTTADSAGNWTLIKDISLFTDVIVTVTASAYDLSYNQSQYTPDASAPTFTVDTPPGIDYQGVVFENLNTPGFYIGDKINIYLTEAIDASTLGISGLTAGGTVVAQDLGTLFGSSGTIGSFATPPAGVGDVSLSSNGTHITVTVTTATTAPAGSFTINGAVKDLTGNTANTTYSTIPFGSF